MTVTLAQLLAAPTLDSIRAKVLAKLQNRGLPTTDWSATGYERMFVEMVSLALQDMVTSGLPTTVGGGFVDYATGDWLTFTSQERYNNTRNAATYTLGTITLTNSTSSAISIPVDSLSFLFPSGNRYHGPIGAGPFTIPGSGSLPITVQSESPNHSVLLSATDTQPIVNYVDASGVAIQMVVAVAGVTASNVAAPYSTVGQTGVGSGVVAPTGTPAGSHNVGIRIDASGQVGGTLVYGYSVDGAAYVTAQTASTQTNLGGITGLGFTLSNGAGTPSFIAGTVYGFSCPGTWITSQGTDAEYDPTLATRDKNKWPSLATLAAIPGSPTLGFYDLLARQAPSIAGSTLALAPSQVTQTLVLTDPNINNKINIYVAGQGGILPPTVVAAINSYLLGYNMLTDFPVAASPVGLPIILGGLTISVKQASFAAAQATFQTNMQSYIAGLGINASTTSGVVRHARIVQIIEDIFGVVDLTDTTMTINGATQSLLLPTSPGLVQLPQWTPASYAAVIWNSV